MSPVASDVIRKTSVFGAIVGGVLCASALPSAVGGPSAALASELADPTGTWLVKDGDARIRIERCPRPQDRVCGYIVWTKDAAGRDDNNPDLTRRGRAILGMQMLLGLAPDGTAYSGPVYNAENGKTYDSHVKRDDASHLILKGCVLKYLCQSQTWTRVDDAAAGQLEGPTNGPDGPRTDPEWAKVVTARKQKR